MTFICPTPIKWNEVYSALRQFYESNSQQVSNSPPVPLILNGWVFSSDLEKKLRWEATQKWAHDNGCAELLPALQKADLYEAEHMSLVVDDPYGSDGQDPESDA